MKPKKIDAARAAFPTSVEDYLPKYSEVPDEFKNSRHPMCRLFMTWFYSGLPQGTQFIPKEGIDKTGALRHIKYCMGSWEPKHEHKEAGVAYLLSLWFERIEVPDQKQPA